MPPYIHQTNKTCSGFPETGRHQADHIPRRPDQFLLQSGDAHTPTDINTGVVSLVRLSHQLQEVTANPNPRDSIPGPMISTISMTVSLPKEKLTKLKQEAKKLLLNPR